jgi:hypothetical protein
MIATLEEVTRKALQLPVSQRIALAGLLLEAENASSDCEVDAVDHEKNLLRDPDLDILSP